MNSSRFLLLAGLMIIGHQSAFGMDLSLLTEEGGSVKTCGKFLNRIFVHVPEIKKKDLPLLGRILEMKLERLQEEQSYSTLRSQLVLYCPVQLKELEKQAKKVTVTLSSFSKGLLFPETKTESFKDVVKKYVDSINKYKLPISLFVKTMEEEMQKNHNGSLCPELLKVCKVLKKKHPSVTADFALTCFHNAYYESDTKIRFCDPEFCKSCDLIKPFERWTHKSCKYIKKKDKKPEIEKSDGSFFGGKSN